MDYTDNDLRIALGEKLKSKVRKVVVYCLVCSSNQPPELKNQIKAMQEFANNCEYSMTRFKVCVNDFFAGINVLQTRNTVSKKAKARVTSKVFSGGNTFKGACHAPAFLVCSAGF